MPTLEHLDPETPIHAQFQEKTGPIVLVNTFTVPADRTEEFLALWQEDAAFMKAQPGFISTQMHRGTAGSRILVNIAVWESTEALARAHALPAFRALTEKLPDYIVARPHILEKVAVDGICVA